MLHNQFLRSKWRFLRILAVSRQKLSGNHVSTRERNSKGVRGSLVGVVSHCAEAVLHHRHRQLPTEGRRRRS